MNDIPIRAIKRMQKPKRVRRDGFAPGIIYGEGFEQSMPVKFEMTKLKRLLKMHGDNAELRLKINGGTMHGIIKEVQTDAITGDIMHIDIYLLSESNYAKIIV